MKNYDEILSRLESEQNFILNDPEFLSENEITSKIIGACIKVHKELGPCLLESTYEICLLHELQKLDLTVSSQVYLPVNYDGIHLDAGYRIDILVENKVILELKSVSELNEIHMAQILTYLKLSHCKVGLLINFNELRVINGIKRVVNGFKS